MYGSSTPMNYGAVSAESVTRVSNDIHDATIGAFAAIEYDQAKYENFKKIAAEYKEKNTLKS